MIIAGFYIPTAYDLNLIITTLADFEEYPGPDKLRLHQLQEIRNQLENSTIPRDTTPARP